MSHNHGYLRRVLAYRQQLVPPAPASWQWLSALEAADPQAEKGVICHQRSHSGEAKGLLCPEAAPWCWCAREKVAGLYSRGAAPWAEGGLLLWRGLAGDRGDDALLLVQGSICRP